MEKNKVHKFPQKPKRKLNFRRQCPVPTSDGAGIRLFMAQKLTLGGFKFQTGISESAGYKSKLSRVIGG